MDRKILIKGAREHNLKNIDVEIPRDKMVVITGLSGSGKSSLAFDTIYAEGHRRYVESLSAFARQFLGQINKPDIDYIEGLSPAISIDQKTTSRNPRSTVGTVTEIYDYLRLLFARVGTPYCPKCKLPITQQTVQQIVDQVMSLPEKTRFQILAPVVRGKKGEHKGIFEDLRTEGFVRVRVDGELRELSEEIELEKNKKHSIEVIVDRLAIRDGITERLADSLETALDASDGLVIIDIIGQEEKLYSTLYACPQCGFSMEELEPRMFSFNSPYGACPECDGLGSNRKVNSDLVIPNKSLSLNEGAIEPYNSSTSLWYKSLLKTVCKEFEIDPDTPWQDLSEEHRQLLLYGNNTKKITVRYQNSSGQWRKYTTLYRGVIPQLERWYKDSTSDSVRDKIEEYMSIVMCPKCKGARLKPQSLSVLVGGKNISEVTSYSIVKALEFFESIELTEREELIARQILKEIRARLHFLKNVGLDYLTLSRTAGTLSGGEAQRIRLATQIGSGLMGVLYILDEPSIGLHQRDNAKLIETLKRLRDVGNTLIVVEHDEDTIRTADFLIDIGPGAGIHGGEIIASGTVDEVAATEGSITGQYLSGKRRIEVPQVRRKSNGKSLKVVGARENNLKNIDVDIPLGVFTCITGVSGSGKSSLINEILYKSLASQVNRSKVRPGAHDNVLGIEYVEKVIDIDQSPIGRTPRSNPATYTKTFDLIRDLFAETSLSKMRGYKKGRFSFNVKGGRCEACRGEGIIKIEMHFLPDVYVPCEVCHGARYNRETLQVMYKGKSIADVLDMTVAEACDFFANIPKIERKLRTLNDVGLGYIKLGQPATQLSGGEAQRVKLATELSKRSNGGTVYILDEPTTGLHMEDVKKLLQVLQRLVDGGSTVIVIEHNLDVIKCADHIIDLGPEGGDRGGTVIATGTPEEVAALEHSYTGQFLKKVLRS